MKQLLFTLLFLFSCATIFAQNFISGGINYTVTSAVAPLTVAVATHTTFTGAANIPATVSNAGNTYSVTAINNLAFRDCAGLTSVSIPTSVTTIGFSAFNSSGLTTIVIPNSVTSVGDSCFDSCSNLTSAVLSNSMTQIPQGLFTNCTSL